MSDFNPISSACCLNMYKDPLSNNCQKTKSKVITLTNR